MYLLADIFGQGLFNSIFAATAVVVVVVVIDIVKSYRTDTRPRRENRRLRSINTTANEERSLSPSSRRIFFKHTDTRREAQRCGTQ